MGAAGALTVVVVVVEAGLDEGVGVGVGFIFRSWRFIADFTSASDTTLLL